MMDDVAARAVIAELREQADAFFDDAYERYRVGDLSGSDAARERGLRIAARAEAAASQRLIGLSVWLMEQKRMRR